MDRYKIGSGTLSLIMERYHAGGIPIEELQMMPPKEVELLFYPQKNMVLVNICVGMPVFGNNEH